MVYTYNNRRKVFKGSKKDYNKNKNSASKKNKQFRNLTNMVEKKLNNLARKRFLENIEIHPDKDYCFWSIVNEDRLCLFKIILMGKNYLVWDRLYGDKWFSTKGIGGPDIDEAINYFESRRTEIVGEI